MKPQLKLTHFFKKGTELYRFVQLGSSEVQWLQAHLYPQTQMIHQGLVHSFHLYNALS